MSKNTVIYKRGMLLVTVNVMCFVNLLQNFRAIRETMMLAINVSIHNVMVAGRCAVSTWQVHLRIKHSYYLLFLTCKALPHQQQCRSNIVECYKSNDSFDKVEIN